MTERLDGLNMPALPRNLVAWLLSVTGLGAVAAAILFHWQLLWVLAGYRPVSPEGNEILLALYLGLPAIVLAAIVSGVAIAFAQWRSHLALYSLWFSIASLVAWAIALFG